MSSPGCRLSLHDALPISQRDTGLSFSVGRPIADFTSLRFSARGSVTRYVLEPPRAECEFDEAGNIENANARSEEHTSELQSRGHLVCRLLLEKKNERAQE